MGLLLNDEPECDDRLRPRMETSTVLRAGHLSCAPVISHTGTRRQDRRQLSAGRSAHRARWLQMSQEYLTMVLDVRRPGVAVAAG
jgi:hypothetical protein